MGGRAGDSRLGGWIPPPQPKIIKKSKGKK
jgi:hypothetical protein